MNMHHQTTLRDKFGTYATAALSESWCVLVNIYIMLLLQLVLVLGLFVSPAGKIYATSCSHVINTPLPSPSMLKYYIPARINLFPHDSIHFTLWCRLFLYFRLLAPHEVDFALDGDQRSNQLVEKKRERERM